MANNTLHINKRVFALIIVFFLVVIFFLVNKLVHQRALVNDGKVWASLYQQQAGEYRALCLQAYNIAKMRVDSETKVPCDTAYAVITDIDETLLDNSPYEGLRALEDSDFRAADMQKWTAKASCNAIPGAVDFLKFAAEKKVTIFYITNRAPVEQAGTLKNLQKFNLPNADADHLLLDTDSKKPSKELRRYVVVHAGKNKKPYKVILLCGDNLADFDKAFDNKPGTKLTGEQRRDSVTKYTKLFGSRYIIIPNIEYDDWEGAYYNYSLPDKEKDKVIEGLLNVDTAAKK
jgi:5'-nucleotidase (lipoprotein e(P4) family)